MRRTSADYLERDALEDIAADFERRGYQVSREVPLGDQRVDLLAERDGERVAIEIKARSRLAQSRHEVGRLREAARTAGLTDFRLVVAMPPHAVDVTIKNLEPELLGYFEKHGLPDELVALSSGTRLERLADIDLEAVDIDRTRIHVRGRAIAEVELLLDNLTYADDVPFTFDLDLDSDLHIVSMNALTFDTAGFSG